MAGVRLGQPPQLPIPPPSSQDGRQRPQERFWREFGPSEGRSFGSHSSPQHGEMRGDVNWYISTCSYTMHSVVRPKMRISPLTMVVGVRIHRKERGEGGACRMSGHVMTFHVFLYSFFIRENMETCDMIRHATSPPLVIVAKNRLQFLPSTSIPATPSPHSFLWE